MFQIPIDNTEDSLISGNYTSCAKNSRIRAHSSGSMAPPTQWQIHNLKAPVNEVPDIFLPVILLWQTQFMILQHPPMAQRDVKGIAINDWND